MVLSHFNGKLRKKIKIQWRIKFRKKKADI